MILIWIIIAVIVLYISVIARLIVMHPVKTVVYGVRALYF